MTRFSDDFNRGDGGLGANWTTPTWSATAPTIVGNRVRSDTINLYADAVYNGQTFADSFARITIPTFAGVVSAEAFVLLRLDLAEQTEYGFWALRNGVGGFSSRIFKFDAAVYTQLAIETANSWASADVLIGTVRGTNILLFRNGTLLLSATDSAVASGYAGLTVRVAATGSLANGELDNFIGGDLPIAFVSAGTEGEAASGNCTPGLPGSLAVNDILICKCHSSDQVAHSMTGDWAQIVQGNGGGATSRLSVWYHRYNGTDSPSAVITHTAGDGIIAGITAYRGCKTVGSPVNIAGAITGGTDVSIEHATVTPTVDYCLLLIINGAADDNTRTLITGTQSVLEDAGGGTENAFLGTSGTTDESISCFIRDVMAAATGTITVTQSAADAWASVLIALEPGGVLKQTHYRWRADDGTLAAKLY